MLLIFRAISRYLEGNTKSISFLKMIDTTHNTSSMNEKRITKPSLIGYWTPLCLFIVLFLPISTILHSQTLDRFEYSEPKMGTEFRLTLYAPDQEKADQAAQAAFDRVDALNKILSDYDPSSELSRLTMTAGSGQKTMVSKDLWRVLSLAQSIAKKSKGAFDVTIGPLSKLWRRAIRQKAVPGEAAMSAAKDKVCYKHLKLDHKTNSVSLTKEGMRLDLGGIAKGYTVDAIWEVLQEHGIQNALIDGGGDIYAKGSPPDSKGWKVKMLTRKTRTASLDFFDPDTKKWSKRLEQDLVVYLTNSAIASSGDTYKFLDVNGVKYSHIINPKTGLGLTHNEIINVSAPNCALADALASALSVLNIKKGNRLLKQFPDCVLY